MKHVLKLVRLFFDLNRRASDVLWKCLRFSEIQIFREYERTLERIITNQRPKMVADIGAGHRSTVAEMKKGLSHQMRVVGVDITQEAMEGNDQLDEKRIADVVEEGVPFENASIDLITSRSVLEHLGNLDRFFRDSVRALKPGGYVVHVFPSRYASFAMLNRLLPKWIARRLLFFFQPRLVGISGYPAFYDRCHYSKIRELVDQHGLQIESLEVSFHGSTYYNFFFPLFLVSVLYEALARAFQAKDLSAYLLLVARRPV